MTTLNQRPTRKDMSFGAQGDLGGYTFTPNELEQATASYYMEKDMSAMAARIDQLQAENDKLTSLLAHSEYGCRIANEQWSKSDERLTQFIRDNILTKEST